MKTNNIIIIVLVMIVVFLLVKPEPENNTYHQEQLKESQYRVDSLVLLINELQPKKHELKDTLNSIDSVYTDISKDSLRARIGHLMLTNIHR